MDYTIIVFGFKDPVESDLNNAYDCNSLSIRIFVDFVLLYVPHVLRSGKHIFDRFAVIFTIVIVWVYAHLLTVRGAYNDAAHKTQLSCRTDHAGLIDATPWIRVPYPFQDKSSISGLGLIFLTSIGQHILLSSVLIEVPSPFPAALRPSGGNVSKADVSIGRQYAMRVQPGFQLSHESMYTYVWQFVYAWNELGSGTDIEHDTCPKEPYVGCARGTLCRSRATLVILDGQWAHAPGQHTLAIWRRPYAELNRHCLVNACIDISRSWVASLHEYYSAGYAQKSLGRGFDDGIMVVPIEETMMRWCYKPALYAWIVQSSYLSHVSAWMTLRFGVGIKVWRLESCIVERRCCGVGKVNIACAVV
ncbi:hypothetical protein Fmac_008666 [Flemingia macrophylla]|uniref:Uncharacterized protein n=1 Tax=Flemingia macrophylla TaxID=520843 RepID=A0ABD1MYK3_9FABA